MSFTTRRLARSPGGRFSLTDCRGSGVPTVTLVSLSLILALTLYEFVDYRRVHMVASLSLSLSSFCRSWRVLTDGLEMFAGALDRRR